MQFGFIIVIMQTMCGALACVSFRKILAYIKENFHQLNLNKSSSIK